MIADFTPGLDPIAASAPREATVETARASFLHYLCESVFICGYSNDGHRGHIYRNRISQTQAVRLCLSAPGSEAEVRSGLETLCRLLGEGPDAPRTL